VIGEPVSLADIRRDRKTQILKAQRIWRDCCDVTEFNTSVVQSYLRHRKIELPVPACMRRWQLNGWIAKVTDLRGRITAVQHRLPTKHAITEGWLGANAIQLSPPLGGQLGLAEGVETAMSAEQLSGIPTWAVCGAKRLDRIDIPPGIDVVHLFADHDEEGLRALQRAARRYASLGYNVCKHIPIGAGNDYNDLLRAQELSS
jgi:hypothetical protein